MAETINVAGATTVKVDTGSAHALDTLSTGGLRNGSEVTLNGYYLDVPTDANGGDNGPPTDIQFFGESADIRLELTKWDTVIEDKIQCLLWGGTAGTPGAVGSLMFQGTLSFRLLLQTTSRPFNFPRVVWRQPRTIGKGTKYSTLVLTGTAYKDGSGILYNAVTT